MWDPDNLEIVNKARQTKAIYYSIKIMRGNLLERFSSRNNLKCLQPKNAMQINPTYVNQDQGKLTKAWIDAIVVGTKASRIWQSVEIEDETETGHRIITALCNGQSPQSVRRPVTQITRYKPDKISKDDFIELKLRVAKIRNNWQKGTRSEQINRLELLTNLATATIKTHQETKARTTLLNRHKRSLGNISDIIKRLQRIDQRNHLVTGQRYLHNIRATIRKLRSFELHIPESTEPGPSFSKG